MWNKVEETINRHEGVSSKVFAGTMTKISGFFLVFPGSFGIGYMGITEPIRINYPYNIV